jgi:perosamine synthetase
MTKLSDLKAKPVQLPSDQDASGRTLGAEEIALLTEAINSGTLTATKGTMVRRLTESFAKRLGVKHCYACSSGTAAIHAAVAAIDPEPGDEIITTAITDMGAITPILFQGAIPVFADVDPVSLNVTADTIERALSPRTRAIIVTHLFGNPAELGKIKALADRHGLPIIEDCAQAFDATADGKPVGTTTAIGCFSFQQGKHITAGEGGLVVTNCDHLARRLRLFIDKAWGYGDPAPDHYFLAVNYRMTELAGAVALGQLPKLTGVVEKRRKLAAELDEHLTGLRGLAVPKALPNAIHTYWRYCLTVDPKVIPGGPNAVASGLKEANVASGPRYIQKPAFECQVLRDRKTFGRSSWPFTLARPEALDYRPELFPGTYEGLARILVLPFNERYESVHIAHVAKALRTQHDALMKD